MVSGSVPHNPTQFFSEYPPPSPSLPPWKATVCFKQITIGLLELMPYNTEKKITTRTKLVLITLLKKSHSALCVSIKFYF